MGPGRRLVAVTGPDLADDRAFAERVKSVLQRMPQLRDVQFGQTLDYPTVDVNVDRERAGLMGVSMADVSRSLVTATSSSRYVVPNYWADANTGVSYQVQVQLPQALMNSSEEVRNISVTTRGGQSQLLRNVGRISDGSATGKYARYNGQRTVSLTANLFNTIWAAPRQRKRGSLRAGKPPGRVTCSARADAAFEPDVERPHATAGCCDPRNLPDADGEFSVAAARACSHVRAPAALAGTCSLRG
jgi:multidrug efflux pump subunit AcrB